MSKFSLQKISQKLYPNKLLHFWGSSFHSFCSIYLPYNTYWIWFFFLIFICRMQKNPKNKMWWSSAQLDKDPSPERGETHFGGTSSGLLSRRCPIVFYIKIFPDSYRWSPWPNLFDKWVFCSSWQPFWCFSNIMSKTLETRLSGVCGSKCLDSRTIFRC